MKRHLSVDLALALLQRRIPGSEPLAGDLLEEFEDRGSRVWLWRQVLLAILLHACTADERRTGLLHLTDAVPTPVPPAGPRAPATWLAASPVHHVGGLGMVVFATLVFAVKPEAWWIVATGILGGLLLGAALIAVRRLRSRAIATPVRLLDGSRNP